MKKVAPLFALLASLLFTSALPLQAQDSISLPKPSAGVSVSFRYNHGHIYLPIVLLDSIKGSFLFDTAAPFSLYIDSTYHANGNLPPEVTKLQGRHLAGGMGISTQQIIVLYDTLSFTIDTLRFSSTFTPIVNLAPIVGKSASGILGAQLLRQYVVELNYPRQRILLHRPEHFTPRAGYRKYPLYIEGGLLMVSMAVRVNSSLVIAGRFLLDTGSAATIFFTSPIERQYKLANVVKEKAEFYSLWGGLGGSTSGFEFRAQSVSIGDFTLPNPIVECSTDQSGAGASTKVAGIVGNLLLERFDIAIDYPNRCIYLRPNKYYSTDFTPSMSGFWYADRTDASEGWIVTSLYKGSNAEKQGLRLNDTITHVNLRPVGRISETQSKLFFAGKEHHVNLTVLRNGKPTTIGYPLVPMLPE